jgi:hypothetical protein
MTSVQLPDLGALEDVVALVEGAGRTQGTRLAPDLRTWLASPEQGLTAGIEALSGAQAGAVALARLAPSNLTVVATVGSDRACWAEITRHSATGSETCIAGLTYAPGGRVSRLVWLRAPLVPPLVPTSAPLLSPSPPTAGDAAPDARPVLEGYFAALMNSRFAEAAAHFSADALYSHPPYRGGAERVLFRGRDALAHGFATDRGPSPARQIITDLWQRGSRAFVEGIIEGIPGGGSFFSTAEISPRGEIARYVAFYSATRIAP